MKGRHMSEESLERTHGRGKIGRRLIALALVAGGVYGYAQSESVRTVTDGTLDAIGDQVGGAAQGAWNTVATKASALTDPTQTRTTEENICQPYFYAEYHPKRIAGRSIDVARIAETLGTTKADIKAGSEYLADCAVGLSTEQLDSLNAGSIVTVDGAPRDCLAVAPALLNTPQVEGRYVTVAIICPAVTK